MKSVIFGIFAHPDDEAFGPSAYFYRQSQKGADVHLVVATDGEAGTNEGYEDLASKRNQEWMESGKRIGTASNLALHYPDGGLCNNVYHDIADNILHHVQTTLDGYKEPVKVEFVSFERNGISGHIDHVVMSLVTTYVYEKCKRQYTADDVTIDRLLYYSLPRHLAEENNVDWLFMPAGKLPEEIDYVHDYSDIADKKHFIMQAHESQKKDMEYVMQRQAHKATDGSLHYSDHFVVHR